MVPPRYLHGVWSKEYEMTEMLGVQSSLVRHRSSNAIISMPV